MKVEVSGYVGLLLAIFGRRNIEILGLRETFDTVLNELPEQEKRILTLRFGLSGGKPLTYNKIAKELDITSDEVKQLELGALRKLHHPSSSRRLRAFIDKFHLDIGFSGKPIRVIDVPKANQRGKVN